MSKQSWISVIILALSFLWLGGVLRGESEMALAEGEDIAVYPITVAVNKSVVLKLPRRAVRVSVAQPQIAEAVVVAPDEILINGKAIGATSLVVWFAQN
jgi:Flp pilus assembly secretin CpaC